MRQREALGLYANIFSCCCRVGRGRQLQTVSFGMKPRNYVGDQLAHFGCIGGGSEASLHGLPIVGLQGFGEDGSHHGFAYIGANAGDE